METTGRQKILVFQQRGSGESKIEGILKHGDGLFSLEIVSIDQALPQVLDDTGDLLPREMEADLALDFLEHPDLSLDLAHICSRRGIPLVASGKKHRVKGVLTPPTWCGLPGQAGLGLYGERFGSPELELKLAHGVIDDIRVLRGAPCGATWEAASRIKGLDEEKAAVRMGLETQFFCTADPAGWDPMYGKSPVHFAGHLHGAAVTKALKRARRF